MIKLQMLTITRVIALTIVMNTCTRVRGSIRARGRRRARAHICNGANNGADAVTDGREYIALEIRGSGAVGILEVICATYHGGL